MVDQEVMDTPEGEVYPVDKERGDIGDNQSSNINEEPAVDGVG